MALGGFLLPFGQISAWCLRKFGEEISSLMNAAYRLAISSIRVAINLVIEFKFMEMRKLGFILLFFCLLCSAGYSQTTYHHISNFGVYEFIDELASLKVVELYSTVKPYSRAQIAEALKQADAKRSELNRRQQGELDFYLADFGKELGSFPKRKRFDLLYRKDSLFSITLNPLLGVDLISNDSALAYHRWVGAEVHGHVAGWGYYASLRDYAENYRLAMPTYLTRQQGGNYKYSGKGGEFSEMRGGVTYSWRWGNVGVVKDNIQWGSGYNGSNILGGRTPSFAMIKLNITPARWVELNYLHGWLVSEVIDSSRTYTSGDEVRKVYHPKYIAANLIAFKPFRGLSLSVGNSIIYSDINVQPAYLIPFLFYKSVDHHLNGMSNSVGQNSQMFFDISSRNIRHLHLYATLFLDEISMKNMFNPDRHSNFYSLKTGVRISDFPFSNLIVTGEYTRTNPLTYRHIINTTTYESNNFNLGHYLQDNADEIYVSLVFRPIRGLQVSMSYSVSRKGPDYSTITTTRLGLPFMESVEWELREWAVGAKYEVINDGYIYLSGGVSDITDRVGNYTPDFMVGRQAQLRAGVCFGF